MGLPLARLTADEFLAWELKQTSRHQFYDGEIFAMPGGTAEHNSAALNTATELKQHLKGTPCKTFMSDMRVRAGNDYFYPDVVVTCGANDTSNPKALEITEPKLIVEVLSPSTVAFDRGQKFASYRLIPSLQEYLLLDPEARTAELFRKNTQGIWELHPSDLMAPQVLLKCISWVGALDTLIE